MLDLHDYKRQLETTRQQLLRSPQSQHNKDIILKFGDYLALRNISYPRITKYYDKLNRIGLMLNKDFDTVTKEDVERVFLAINHRSDLAISTKIDYNILIKRFYKWLLGNDEEYPLQVKWLKTTLKFKDKPTPSQADLITEEETEQLIDAAEHPRNKAFISLLYETGCRIGELANLKIGNVLFDQYGCVLNVNGKTGPRRVRVVNSTSLLTHWLEIHPFKKDREQALWALLLNNKNGRQMKYQAIRKMLQDTFKKAGITKRCNPHIFRHSRATFMANHMTEAQMKAYFGWVQHSDMASIYVHLSGRDTDNAILELNGLANKESTQPVIQPKKCSKCAYINNHASIYCNRCSSPLDTETAIQLQNDLLARDAQQQQIGTLFGTLMQDEEFKQMLFRKISAMKMQNNVELL